MKKLLSALVSVAIITSSLLSYSVTSFADEENLTKVIKPEYVDSNGSVLEVSSNDSAFPEGVVLGGTATPAKDLSGLTGIPSASIKGSAFIKTKTVVKGTNVGVLFYIKTPDNGVQTRPQIYIMKNGQEDQYQWGYTDWYIIGRDDTAWTNTYIENYGPLLPAGFEGYIYIPFTGLITPAPLDPTETIDGFKIWIVNQSADVSVTMSAPIVVSEGLVNNLPSIPDVSVDGTVKPLFKSDATEETLTNVLPMNYITKFSESDSQLPASDVLVGGTATPAYNPCALASAPAVNISSYAWIATKGISGGKGIMFYIETPQNNIETLPQIYLIKNSASDLYQYTGASWYTLSENESQWVQRDINNYGPTLPANFKGYLYIPFSQINVSDPITSDDQITGFKMWVANQNASENVLVGNPWIVMDNLAENNLPTTTSVKYNNDKLNYYESFSFADQDIPEYDGEQINYCSADIMKAFIPRFPVEIEKNKNINETSFYDGSEDNDYTTLVDSKIGITNIPSFSVNKHTNKDELLCSQMTIGSYMAGARGVMFYVDMPDNAGIASSKILFNFRDSKNNYFPAYIYSGSCSILEKGSKQWETLEISNYNFNLPAGFEGFIKYDFDSLYAEKDMDFLSKMEAANLFIENTTDEPVIVSAPVAVKKSDSDSYAVYLNGNEKAARDLFTGNVYDYNSLGHDDTEFVVTTQPTILTEGEMQKTCSICHQTLTIKILALGDVNGDHTVNVLDFIRLKKFLANENTQIEIGTGDLDGNNVVLADDLVILRKEIIK